jgi:hypothetical protein
MTDEAAKGTYAEAKALAEEILADLELNRIECVPRLVENRGSSTPSDEVSFEQNTNHHGGEAAPCPEYGVWRESARSKKAPRILETVREG